MKRFGYFLTAGLILTLALTAAPAFAADGKVNINDADAGELALLPRIGPSIAGRIIEFRDENGKFESAEDLMLVRGIGEKTFELLEPFIALSGETTLQDKVSVSELQRKREAEEREEEEKKE